ncbi:MAG: cytochrome P450 [Pseudomonadota bacterium]
MSDPTSISTTRIDIASETFKRAPGALCQELRALGPLVRLKMPIVGMVHVATTHAAVEELLKNDQDFSNDFLSHGPWLARWVMNVLPGPLRLLGRNMLVRDGADHRRMRKLVDGAFRRPMIAQLRDQITRLTDQHLDRLAAAPDHDVVPHLARNLPLAVICEMLGLPIADRDKFSAWMAAMSSVASLPDFIRLTPALNRIKAYLTARFAEVRAQPPGERPATLMAALVTEQEQDGTIDDDELIAMCFLLFVAGHETTTHAISGGLLEILSHPERPTVANGATAADEILRHVSPVMMSKPRMALRDTRLAGHPIPAGSAVMALLIAANRDPSVFAHPEQLDITRTPNRHLAFGTGPHVCLGAWLARLEIEIVLKRFTARFPGARLAIAPEDVPYAPAAGMRAITRLPLHLPN